MKKKIFLSIVLFMLFITSVFVFPGEYRSVVSTLTNLTSAGYGSVVWNFDTSVWTLSNVGIGTSSSLKALHIDKTTETSSQMMFGPGITNVNLAIPGITFSASSGNTGFIMGVDDNNYGTFVWNADATPDYWGIDATSGIDLVLQHTNGANVGVGTITPSTKFEVNGTSTLTGGFNLGAGASYTLASNAITLTAPGRLRVATEGNVALDTLSTISGGIDGDIIIITTILNNKDVTFTTAGNIMLGTSSRGLDERGDIIMFMYQSAITKWCEISFVNN